MNVVRDGNDYEPQQISRHRLRELLQHEKDNAELRAEIARLTTAVPASPPQVSDEVEFRAFVQHEKGLMLKKLDEFHALDVEGRRPYFARLQAFAEVQQWLDRADRGAAALAGVPRARTHDVDGKCSRCGESYPRHLPMCIHADYERETQALAGVPSPAKCPECGTEWRETGPDMGCETCRNRLKSGEQPVIFPVAAPAVPQEDQ